MRPFTYSRPVDLAEAIHTGQRQPQSKYLGGGTNLVDLMKMGVERPAHLVDITRLPMAQIEERAGGLHIGAMARNSEVAAHAAVRRRYPVLSHSILSGASPQIRNMATIGGNLLQRTRCYYFYDPGYTECNKRTPGSGCAAILGYNRIHAILGVSEHCITAYPGDMAVALAALEAEVMLRGPQGERSLPIDRFYRLPADTPNVENEMQRHEIITAVALPAASADKRSYYIKVRDRNSYAFALVSVAAVLDIGAGNRVRQARIALGGIAPKPWRALEAEEALANQPAEEHSFRNAAQLAVRDARPHRDNAFKIKLAHNAIVRALMAATNEPV